MKSSANFEPAWEYPNAREAHDIHGSYESGEPGEYGRQDEPGESLRAAAALNALASEIATSTICPELKAQATQLVMGEGSPTADIVIIGEAPGEQEDRQGRPFVGASGKSLDAMLASIQLNRSDIYITNIVKYRPPNNRDPKKSEKAAFLPYLLRQLEIIQPKIILTLGGHSLSSFMPDATIGDVHGQPQRITLAYQTGEQPVLLVPQYHPAAAMYNRSLHQTLVDDFLKIPQILNSIK